MQDSFHIFAKLFVEAELEILSCQILQNASYLQQGKFKVLGDIRSNSRQFCTNEYPALHTIIYLKQSSTQSITRYIIVTSANIIAVFHSTSIISFPPIE